MAKPFKECVICESEHSRRGVTCNNSCAATLRAKAIEKFEKVCKFCGDTFEGEKKSVYCKKLHMLDCEVCGASFSIPRGKLARPARTCGSGCGSALSHTDEAKAKRRENSLAKYGVEHPLQAEEIKAKIEKGIAGTAGRFGTEASLAAMRKAHGVDNIRQSPEFIAKEKERIIAKYGVDNVAQLPEVQAKIKATNLERYGEASYARTEAFKNELQELSLKKYGVAHPLMADSVRAKISATNLERYGTEAPLGNEVVQAKKKATSLERYGVENPSQSQIVKAKIQATNLERYGHGSVFGSAFGIAKLRATMLERYGVEHPLQVPEFAAKAQKTLQKRVNSGEVTLMGGRVSKLNLRIAALLEERFSLQEPVVFERSVERSSFDLYIAEANLLIDLNPTVSHNSLLPFGCLIGGCEAECTLHKPLRSSYHFERAELAAAHGYRLLQIYDWDSEEALLRLVAAKVERGFRKISARKLQLRRLSTKEARTFFEEFHGQGAGRGYSHSYGLFEGEELLAAAAFGEARFGRTAEFEFLRYAVAPGLIIHGGSGALFKAFLTEFAPESVVSYIDFNHTTGPTFLSSLGFEELRKTGQATVWFSPKTGVRIPETSLLAVGADRLLGTSYGSREESGLDNKSIMVLEGFLPVSTAGNRVFLWSSSKL